MRQSNLLPVNWLFRLSAYLVLVLGGVCLGYAEWDYLPEATLFTGIVILAMALAFVLDGYQKHLSLGQANLAGFCIFVLAGCWLYYHYQQPESLMHTLPWPAGGLPYLGPLLLLLIAAKLFRPKQRSDWWGLYCISLAAVGLGMSLAEDVVFIGLVMLYAVCATWSLSLFQFHRVAEDLAKQPATLVKGPIMVGRAVVWSALAALLAAPLFFITPRTAGMQWELFRTKMESGLPLDNAPDLSRTGYLTPSREVAFEVIARNLDGSPKTDLPLDQRWRAISFTVYQSPRGRWNRLVGLPLTAPMENRNWRSSSTLKTPDFGPEAYTLEFRLVARMPATVFADPIVYKSNQQSPIATPTRRGYSYAFQDWDASFVLPYRELRTVNRYFQITRPVSSDDQPDWTSFKIFDSVEAQSLLSVFLLEPPQGVKDYMRQLVNRLVQEQRISAAAYSRMSPDYQFQARDHAEIAQAFCDFFRNRGEYSYSLNLRRINKSIDPIEDFLLNSRNGHCERFATALSLLLRAAGIPCQLVLGFRGCEHIGGGRYLVHQNKAHAWVEVLLPRDFQPSNNEWYWQAYDPTPAAAADDEGGVLNFAALPGRRIITDYIIRLNPDTQRRLAENATAFLEETWPALLALPLLLSLLGFALFRLRKRLRWHRQRAATNHPVAWYTRFREILAQAGVPNRPGETPAEFALHAKKWLQQFGFQPTELDFIDQATDLLHQQRYAMRDMPGSEFESLQARLELFSARREGNNSQERK